MRRSRLNFLFATILYGRSRLLVAGESFAGTGGIVLGIRNRHRGIDGTPPADEQVVQLLRAERLAVDQITALAQIVSETEKL